MAISATNLAFVNLRRDPFPRGAVVQQIADLVCLIAPDVIELKDPNIAFTAIDARATSKYVRNARV